MSQKRFLNLTYWPPSEFPTGHLFRDYQPGHVVMEMQHVRAYFAAWDGAEFKIFHKDTGAQLSDFNAVYLAGWRADASLGYALAVWMEQHKIPFIGRSTLGLYPSTKLEEMVRLATNGVRYPRSYYASLPKDIPKLYEWAHQNSGLEFPVIIKGIDASHGDHNFLVKSADELTGLPLDDEKRYIMQEYIPNQCDYRLLILGGEVKLIIRRTRASQDTHLNNTSQGAAADIVAFEDFPKEGIDLALKAAAAMDRTDIAGVDILIDESDNSLYVLEVNRTPNISIGTDDVAPIKIRALLEYMDAIAT